jgi:arylsulfatase A
MKILIYCEDAGGHHMNENPVTRRRLLRMSALAGGVTLGFFGLRNLIRLFDKKSTGDSIATAKDSISSSKVTLKKVKNFTGSSPNVIVIYTDDLGYGDLSCYGSRAIKTPNIDRMAREGIKFTDFYSCNALCSPARFGLLTGRYPRRRALDWPLWPEKQPLGRKAAKLLGHIFGKLGLTDMGVESDTQGIPAEEITIAEALKVAGYRTGLVGKWHLGDFTEMPEYNPLKHGFDEFYGVPFANGNVPFPLYRGEERLMEDIRGEEQGKLTGLYTKEAIKFIEKAEKPFFLYLAHTFPHRPLHASKKFRYTSKAGLYGDVVEEIDWSVGEIMACLRRNGLERNTLVIFSSDNGPWYYGSSGGLRGGKGQSFEGGFRVPFIAKWPGRIKPNSSCTEPAMIIDIFPTLLHLNGIEQPKDRIIDGKNILGLLTGKEKKSPHDAFYFYHHDELEGVRAGKWKYFRKINLYKYPVPVNKTFAKIAAGKLGKWPLLYDMDLDPFECYNMADNMPDMVVKMEGIMKKWEREMVKNPEGWIKQ